MKRIFTFLMAVCFAFSVNAQINETVENYTSFTINPAGIWTWVDQDALGTYGFEGISFENAYQPMAAIVFEPGATNPPMETITPHGGDKLFAFFAATTPPNDDWMISPKLTSAGTLKFWAKSFTGDYGLERLKVLTSSTDNSPSSFTKINDGNYISVPDADWTEYTFEIPATAKYFAFNCVSSDAFILLLDDITFSGTVAVEEAVITSSIYPNPASDFVTISTQENINKVEVYNVLGQLVYANEEGNNQVMVNVADFSNGVYVAKVYTNSGVSTKKFNVLR